MRVAAILLSLSAALALASATEAHPAKTTRLAAGSYDNALIATTALKYVGQWGGNACADAHRSGETASTSVYPTYPDGYSASTPPNMKSDIKPANGGDGQCRSFVNCIVWMASGKTQWIGLDPTNYFAAFTGPTGGGPPGMPINNVADLTEGDIVQEGKTADDPTLHTFIVVAALGGDSFDVVDSNYSLNEFVQERQITVRLGTDERAFQMGAIPPKRPPTPAANPRIVFVRQPRFRVSEIWTMLPDGTGQRLVATNGSNPAWSPNHQQIVFDPYLPQSVSGVPVVELLIVGADGQGLHQLTNVFPMQALAPTWSPDGHEIAFVGAAYGANAASGGLFLINADGSGLRRIRADPPTGNDGVNEPSWSPDGSHIAFAFANGLYVSDRNGRNLTRVSADTCSGILWPSWSPDGKQLAFDHCAAGGGMYGPAHLPTIAVVDLDGKNLRPDITTGTRPAWSPDGKWIVFTGHVSQAEPGLPYTSLFKVHPDGSGRVRLTHFSSCGSGICSGDDAANW